MNMACNKCINVVIMKQIQLAEFVPEPCDCVIEDWFKTLKRNAYSQDKTGEKQNE